jgi:hypothetical protein
MAPVSKLRTLITWLLSALIFSREAFEKKDMLPFFV